jgi:predicted DNA-binding transcriptional regulator AlpA
MPEEIGAPLRALAAQAAELPVEAIPATLGAMEQVKVALWARLMRDAARPVPVNPPAGAERLLTAKEAARMANVEPKWLYRRAGSIPGVRRLSPKTIRFEEQALRRWLAARRA